MIVASWFSDHLKQWLSSVSPGWLYLITFVMTFAETGTLLFFIPGEFTLLLAGAAAGVGRASLPGLIVVGIVAAVTGDFVGFQLGKRYGSAIRNSRLGRKIKTASWERAADLIERRKGPVVLVGRWIGFLRAIMPASAGMSGMKYTQFLPWDLLGAISWATICILIGYEVGDKIDVVEKWIGRGGFIVVGLGLVGYLLNHRRKNNNERRS